MNARMDRKAESTDVSRQSGFTLLELIIVLFISLVITGIAIPRFVQTTRNLRLAGDARNIAETLGQAKLRAAADFTDARAYFDFATGTYRVDVWDKPNSCWMPDHGTDVNGVTLAVGCLGPGGGPGGGVVPGMNLSANVSFAGSAASPAVLATVGAPPPNSQPAIAQAPPCRAGTAGGATPADGPWQGATFANSACVVFNSRGVPIQKGPGGIAPTSNDVVYVTDGNNLYGLTVSQTGLIRTWSTPATGANWFRR